MTIYLELPLPAVSSDLPEYHLPRATAGSRRSDILFGLAPDGVYLAIPVAGNAVSSCLAISPLP